MLWIYLCVLKTFDFIKLSVKLAVLLSTSETMPKNKTNVATVYGIQKVIIFK